MVTNKKARKKKYAPSTEKMMAIARALENRTEELQIGSDLARARNTVVKVKLHDEIKDWRQGLQNDAKLLQRMASMIPPQHRPDIWRHLRNMQKRRDSMDRFIENQKVVRAPSRLTTTEVE